MSTELKSFTSVIPATAEENPVVIPMGEYPDIKFHYNPVTVSNLHLTRFSGGSAGTKLQITIQNGVTQHGVTYTTLSRTQVKDLVKTLQEAFELTDEPNDDQDEEILSDCCGADSWWSDKSLCGK